MFFLLYLKTQNDFSRKPQSLSEYSQLKATGIVAVFVIHWPFCLVQICCDYAEKLLKFFITNFANIYGSKLLVYNTHSLIHLSQDARKYGALDFVSCFPFENLKLKF